MKKFLMSRFLRSFCAAFFAIALIFPSVAQAQTEPAPQVEEEFVSWDTLTVGCAAGGFASGVAMLLPLFTTYAAGGPTFVTWELMGGWIGLGCAVGIWAGALAIGTALLLEGGGEA